MDEIWLVPHRDGMLRINAHISHVGKQESVILEMLATGDLVTPSAIAARIWPAKVPEYWQELITARMTAVRKLLPKNFVRTVYKPGTRRVFNLLHGAGEMTGWQLIGKINVHPAAGAADIREGV